MDWLPGRTLADRLRADPPLPIPEILQVARETAQGSQGDPRAWIAFKGVAPPRPEPEQPLAGRRLAEGGLVAGHRLPGQDPGFRPRTASGPGGADEAVRPTARHGRVHGSSRSTPSRSTTSRSMAGVTCSVSAVSCIVSARTGRRSRAATGPGGRRHRTTTRAASRPRWRQLS